MRNFKFLSFIFLASLVIFSPLAAKAEVIAKIIALSHGVIIERNGSQVSANVEDEIHAKDTIITDGTGKVQLMFNDHTFASLSTNTVFTMSDFNFTQNDASFTANIGSGFARFVTGKIVEQNPESFKVITPEATVGIRGTTFSVETINSFTTVSVENSNKIHSVVVNNTVIPVGYSAIFGPQGRVTTPPTLMNQGQRQGIVEKSSISFLPSTVNPNNPDRLPAYDTDSTISQNPPYVFEDQQSIGTSSESSAAKADSNTPGTFNPNLVPPSSGGTSGTTTGGIAGYAPGTVLNNTADVTLGVSYQSNTNIETDGKLQFDVDLRSGAISNAQAQLPSGDLINPGGQIQSDSKGTGSISGTQYSITGSDWKNDLGTVNNSTWNANGNVNIPNNTADGSLEFIDPASGLHGQGTITGVTDVEFDD